VLDANHGSGSLLGPRLLEALGCETTTLGGEPDGRFEHEPEPTEQNLKQFCEAVRQAGADLGFAVDPDADRLALVDGNGRYLGEEYTLALAIRHVASKSPGTVVVNSSTSRVSEDVAVAAGCQVLRTKVGEVHVAERMREVNAIIGGEGNGGVIDPRVGYGRDSAVGMALILELLAQSGQSLAALRDEAPTYQIRKEKYYVDRTQLGVLFDALKEKFADGVADEQDGLRIDWDDRWVQIRASNTEPIVRVIAEAQDSRLTDQLCASVDEVLQRSASK
jgi:phosphomannomutase